MKVIFIKLIFIVITLSNSILVSATTSADFPLLGEVKWVAFNFAPRGWAFCDGSLLPISQNTALFSLLGTTYGGDGRTNFALPDLRSRVMLHEGQGPGLSNRRLGSKSGAEQDTISLSELATHKHQLTGSSSAANSTLPNERAVAKLRRSRIYNSTANVDMDSTALANEGQSQPHQNMAPSISLNCIIALQGQFPSRN